MTNINEQRKSIDNATPEEWDALHSSEASDSGIETGNAKEAKSGPSEATLALMDRVCFECG